MRGLKMHESDKILILIIFFSRLYFHYNMKDIFFQLSKIISDTYIYAS